MVQREFDVKLVGRAADVRERFYAISMEAKLKHPAMVAVCEAAVGSQDRDAASPQQRDQGQQRNQDQ